MCVFPYSILNHFQAIKEKMYKKVLMHHKGLGEGGYPDFSSSTIKKHFFYVCLPELKMWLVNFIIMVDCDWWIILLGLIMMHELYY